MISPILSAISSTMLSVEASTGSWAFLALLVVLVAISIALGAACGASYILRDPRRRRSARLTASRLRLVARPPFLALQEPVRYDPARLPPQAEWGQRRAHLARLGVRQQDIDHILGNRSDLQTRRASAEKMAGYCRRLKRAGG